jgi:hypothetical protein
MKKINFLFMTMTLCLALTMPASAKVTVGGAAVLDVYYHRYDSDAALNWFGTGTDDWQQLEIEVPTDTNLYAEWINDDGNVGMYIELELGGENGSTDVGLAHAYGWWQITPMFKLLAGHTDGSFATLEPDQALGGASGHSAGVGFGNLGVVPLPQLRLEIKFNDMVSVMISAVDPREGNSFDWGTFAALPGNEENVWPRFDIAVPLNIGPFYIEPSMSWMKVKHDEASMNMGAASSYNITAYVLGVMYTTGPFSISAEGAFGQNWFNSQLDYDSLLDQPLGFTPAGVQFDREFNFEDTEDCAFWVDVAFEIGPATIHAIYGYQETDIFMWLGSQEGEVEYERQMYGISVPIEVAKTFVIRPEFMVYDWGEADIPSFWPQADIPFGTEYIGGVQFVAEF